MKTIMVLGKHAAVDICQRRMSFLTLRDVFLLDDAVGHEHIDCKNTEDEHQNYENYDNHDRVKICSYLRL